MARDYKHRAQPRKTAARKNNVAWWKWLLIIVLISVFIAFLYYLQASAPENKAATVTKKTISTSKPKKTATRPKHQDKQAEEPRYDFYTILPESEVVVPDYEIKTRIREERLGKAKTTQYLIQAGSFRQFAEADKLRARLALMGIESRVEKAKVGNAIWNRVKMGPFTRSSSVSSIKERLRQNGIDVIVTEKEG